MPYTNGSKWPGYLNMVAVVAGVLLEGLRAYLRWQAAKSGPNGGR